MNNKEKDRLFYRFINGETIEEIGNDLGLGWSATYQLIAGRLPCVVELDDRQKIEICQLYNDGWSCPKIAERYKISHKLVGKILDENGISRKRNGVRKYTLNEHYFDQIDTQNKAYILGLLYADGNNNIEKSTVRLQLQEGDKDILEKISVEVGTNRPLRYVDCSNRIYGNNYVSKNMFSFDVYSKHMCKALDYHGMKENKSLILEYPNFLSDDLHRHFIRGYFDGDGSISFGRNSLLTITSTESFCNDCINIIRNNVAVGGNIYDASCHNGITKLISICGRIQCKHVLDWLYYDAELYLQRKYDIYLNYFSNAA